MLIIGIVGLPNVGKSTLFQAITRHEVAIADYPFTTIDPNIGVVAVPDERLEKIAALIKPKKHLAATIEFVDIAGLVKGAHQGEGLGNQFLSHIYAVDAVLFLIRLFKEPDIPALAASPDEELAILKNELLKKDEEVASRTPEVPRLTLKPTLIIGNMRNGGENFDCSWCHLVLDAKLELELAELAPEEARELGGSKLGELVSAAYRTLDLITFYTIKGGKEVRAWPLKKGLKAPEAGGVVHTDFKEKFIRAEVIQWDKLLEAGSPAVSAKQSNPWSKARERGWIATEGRDYEVRDGDVLEFKI